jgi:hypothetical protein
MALSEDDKINIAKILKVTYAEVKLQEDNLGIFLTDAMVASIQDLITRYDSVGSKYISFAPTESNQGFTKNPNDEKRDIREQIAILLERGDWVTSNSASVQGYVYRG